MTTALMQLEEKTISLLASFEKMRDRNHLLEQENATLAKEKTHLTAITAELEGRLAAYTDKIRALVDLLDSMDIPPARQNTAMETVI